MKLTGRRRRRISRRRRIINDVTFNVGYVKTFKEGNINLNT